MANISLNLLYIGSSVVKTMQATNNSLYIYIGYKNMKVYNITKTNNVL